MTGTPKDKVIFLGIDALVKCVKAGESTSIELGVLLTVLTEAFAFESRTVARRHLVLEGLRLGRLDVLENGLQVTEVRDGQ